MRPLQRLEADLRIISNPEKAKTLALFFRQVRGSMRGQYLSRHHGAGMTANCRELFISLPQRYLKPSQEQNPQPPITALVILVDQYQKSDEHGKQEIADFCIAYAVCINNCYLRLIYWKSYDTYATLGIDGSLCTGL